MMIRPVYAGAEIRRFRWPTVVGYHPFCDIGVVAGTTPNYRCDQCFPKLLSFCGQNWGALVSVDNVSHLPVVAVEAAAYSRLEVANASIRAINVAPVGIYIRSAGVSYSQR